MSDTPPTAGAVRDPDVVLALTLYGSGRLEVYQQEGRTGPHFAGLLRVMANRFERGEVTRVE
jgi:hypothetical protein